MARGGGNIKASASGRTSQPQPVNKRRYSQVEQDSDDDGPRRVVTPPFDPDSIGSGRQENVDPYESGFRSKMFQGHGSAGLHEPGIEHEPQKYVTAARPDEIVEISDDSSNDDPASVSAGSLQHAAAVAASTNLKPGGLPGNRKASKPRLSAEDHAKLMAENPYIWSLENQDNYQVALGSLAEEIPQIFHSKGPVKSRKIWLEAVRYLDQLHGTRLEAQLIATEGRKKKANIPNLRKTLFEYMKSCPNVQFGGHGDWKEGPENAILLAKELAYYFKQHNKRSTPLPSKVATADAPKAVPECEQISDVHHTGTMHAGTANVSSNLSASDEHEDATHGIQELSVGDPPKGVAKYYRKHYSQGTHYIGDLPTDTSSARDTGAAESSEAADIDPVVKNQRVSNHGRPLTKIQAFVRDIDAQYTSRTKPQPIEQARRARDAQQARTVFTHVEINPTSNTVASIRSEKAEDKKIMRIKTEASNDVDAGCEIVAQAMKDLQQCVKGAISQKLDWDSVPVALFETEMGIRRVQKAVDEAKEAVAKHGYQVKRI